MHTKHFAEASFFHPDARETERGKTGTDFSTFNFIQLL